MVSQPAADVAERYSRGGLWVAIMVMSVWHLFSTLPIVISGWLQDGFPASGAPIWLVYAVVGAVSAWIVLRGGGDRLILPLTVCPVLLAGVAVAPFQVPTGFFDHYDWPFAVSGWFALVALWRRSIPELLGFFAANAGVGLATLVALGETDRVSLARFVVVCCGVSVLQIAIFVGNRAVAATARQLAQTQQAVARVRTARLAAESVQTARRVRYAALRETVVDLLRGLATGELDPSEPATRQQLAVAVTRLRSYFPARSEEGSPLWHELEACADAGRRRGIAVDLVGPAGTLPPLPADARRALIEPVIQVLAASPARARVTAVASSSEVVIAVVADAGAVSPSWVRHPAVRVDYDVEGGAVWVQTQWSALSPSPW